MPSKFWLWFAEFTYSFFCGLDGIFDPDDDFKPITDSPAVQQIPTEPHKHEAPYDRTKHNIR